LFVELKFVSRGLFVRLMFVHMDCGLFEWLMFVYMISEQFNRAKVCVHDQLIACRATVWVHDSMD
jgi:hypothetical protein